MLALAFAAGCGDPVDRDIDALIAGGDEAEQAKISLNLAKSSAVAPLVEAFRDREHPTRARVALAEALYRIYLREKTAAAYEGLIAGLAEPEPEIRAAIARSFGDIAERKALSALLATFEKERDPKVQLEILKTFEMLGLETISNNNPSINLDHLMKGDEVERFTRALVAVRATDDSLAAAKDEWLENIAETMAVHARKSLLTGRLDEAEKTLTDALDLVPESHNINFQLGKFYYQNGQPDKGLALVDGTGLIAYVTPLAQTPTVDGDLGDPAWAAVEPLTRFYQLLQRMDAYPSQGRSEVYLGYRDQMLYVGVKGYEPRTDNLQAAKTQRDDGIWQDDCVEIYLDPNHDARTYYQLDVNSLGAFDDLHYQMDGGLSGVGYDWNSEHIQTAAQVAETFWSMELSIPVADFHGARVQPGDVWGFNIAQVRIANLAESAQWAPTYGWSQQPDRFGFLVFK